MTDNISGVEHETVKSCQPVHSFGASLLEESESALMHPIDTIERAGSATLGAVERAGSYTLGAVERAGSATLGAVESAGSATLGAVERAGSATYGALKSGASFVGRSAENLYGRVMGGHGEVEHQIVLNQGGESNLDKLNQHMEMIQQPQPIAGPTLRTRTRNVARTVVNWVILLLVLLLIGVIVYLTCKRYSLVGNALNTGDRLMAAALLSPELSTGLSTLAAVL